MLQGKEPENVVILSDGEILEKQYYEYNIPNMELNIQTTNKNTKTYKIIYNYPEIKPIEENIELSTKATTKFENIEEEIEAENQQEITLQQTGEKVSIEGEITKEVYKGYLYEAKENETIYKENYILEISDTQNIEEININKEKEKYTYYLDDETETKIENDTNQSTYFKQTTINKQQMLKLLGEDGIITIKNAQDEPIGQISKDSIEDENGNIIINYENQDTKDIKINTTKPIQLGQIKIQNKKAIDSKIQYNKQEIEQFENLESTIKANESNCILQMKLLNTKSEAKINMEKAELSAMKENQNIQMMVTLLANSNQYDLYKNPTINMIFPKELEMNIKSITQLNFEEQMKIKNAWIKEENDGKKKLTISLEGEQEEYIKNANEGIQISIVADIKIPNTTLPKEENIELYVTNENKQEETKTSYPFKITSKYGVLVVNQTEDKQTIDDEEVEIELNAYSNEKAETRTTKIINNYENAISKVSIIGTIIDEKQEMDINFQDIKIPQNKNAKIYYSEDSNQWKENIEEVEKIKAYKIIVEDDIQSGENIDIGYTYHIAENLNAGSTSYIENILEYENQNNTEKTISNIKFTTKNEKINMFQTEKATEENGMKVEISAITGSNYLKENDTVKEGQGIRYKIRVTNQTEQEMSNIVLEATNTNAIYYDLIEYEEEVDDAIFTKYKIEENEELTSKQLKIETLKPGETKEVSYQISVKEVENENETLTGEIKITADNQEEKTIQNITNKIEQSEIKATLRFLYTEDVVTAEGSGIPLLINVQNLSDQELQDTIVEIPLAEGLKDFTENDLFMSGEEPYQFIECKDRVIKFKIPKIEAKQTEKIIVKPGVDVLDITKEEATISQYCKIKNNGKEYITNDIERKITQTKVAIEAIQTTNRQEKNVKDGDNIKFNIKIQNKGVVSSMITIEDKIPYGLKVNSATLKTSEKEEKLEHEARIIVGDATIKPNEIIELEIDTTVDAISIVKPEIENYVEINGINVSEKSNKVSFIVGLIKDDNDDPSIDDPGTDDPSTDDPNNDKDLKYNISGIAWVDSNQNGQQDNEEAKMPNMQVWLINEETGDNYQENTKEDGTYSFQNVKKGNYTVMFQYNTKKYTVTTYQKEGIPQNINSDVMESKMKIQDRELTIAKTKTLTINSKDLENIDAGFIETKEFDLKIDKTINKVAVQTNKGTKVITYNQTKLGKVEIDAKQIANSNITIEYNIAITNQGKVAGYANEIIDYLPKDVIFTKDLNNSWTKLKDGSISTKELSNQIINPGETKNITLTVSKKMTEEDTGTITNKAKINKYSSDYTTEDINTKNNESQAELIISIRTGRIIVYTILIISVATMIAVSIYAIKKEVL